MNKKNKILRIFELIKDEQVELKDWPVFIESLRYVLLPMISGFFDREDKICSHWPFEGFNEINSSLADVIKSAIGPFKKRVVCFHSVLGKKIIYSTWNNRFIETTILNNHASRFFWITDRLIKNKTNLYYVPCAKNKKSTYSVSSYFYSLLDVLGKHRIWLNEVGLARLSFFSLSAIMCIERARFFFSYYPVDALVVDGDSWLPNNGFVQIAKKNNIPTVCVQHGLDCEHWCLDEAFSDYYCVWGTERKVRYFNKSTCRPSGVFVTGNPLFDSLRFPKKVSDGGPSWLLLTRPHSPEKCYEPSRYPQEGKDVLRLILDELRLFPEAKLVIKAHPKDDICSYHDLIEVSGLSGRIFLASTKTPCMNYIQQSDIVFSEDSTAGAEAMILGKPVIHVSACKAGPCLPFVDYGAALSGLNSELLHDSICRLYAGLSRDENKKMNQGQVDFIRDYCGELDGKAGQRVASVVRRLFDSA